MLTPQRRRMLGLAECPHCGHELTAPLGAGGKTARCTACDQRFRLPSAEMLFNNAAVYLMLNQVEDLHADDTRREIRFSA
ncbi:MAG: hypothetical protein AAF710_09905 [Planctomycetota bacterium]